MARLFFIEFELDSYSNSLSYDTGYINWIKSNQFINNLLKCC